MRSRQSRLKRSQRFDLPALAAAWGQSIACQCEIIGHSPMFRRYLVTILRRSILALMVVCLGCSAQLAPSDVAQRVERQVRAFYNIPAQVKVILGPIKTSEFPANNPL